MKRRQCLRVSTGAAASLWLPRSLRAAQERRVGRGMSAELVIIGGSLGGCAAALTALENGLRVILTEETDWLGGQLTSQAVPPDEHAWIETHGATRRYRSLREEIRSYYRRHYPLTEVAKNDPKLNPGRGSVSRLCHEPRVALAVIENALAPYRSRGQLTVLLEHVPLRAERVGARVRTVAVRSQRDGVERELQAPCFVDATELGDLLPLTQTAYRTGAEARSETQEWHAAEKEDPANQQAFTVCFALEHRPGESHVADPPADYGFWKDFVPTMTPPWPGKLLDWTYTHPRSREPRKLGFNPVGNDHDGVVNLWTYRRIAASTTFQPPSGHRDLSLVNWPQNDYFLKPLIGGGEMMKEAAIREGKQLSLSLLYWMQTEAPRHDGGLGYPGLRLRPEVMGTRDGLAKYPYVRESRRILAETTIVEGHCGKAQREEEAGPGTGAVRYPDAVGIGYYPIDLHPSTSGDNYIDFDALPFEIPLGALLPREVENVLPACKNLGSTHVTNGCYRLHPVEWGIGEAVGALVAYSQTHGLLPREVRNNQARLTEFQKYLEKQGVELAWPVT